MWRIDTMLFSCNSTRDVRHAGTGLNGVISLLRHSVLFACALAAVSAAAPARAGEAQLGAWRDYALRGITPEYTWAGRPAADAVRPSVIDSLQPVRTMRMPELQFAAAPAIAGGLSFGYTRALASDTPFAEDGGLSLIDDGRAGIERTVVAPTISGAFGDGGRVDATVMLAYQRFASPNLNAIEATDGLPPSALPASGSETSYGSGVRLGMAQDVGAGVSFRAAYQSQVNMSTLRSYSGVYADAGDFDMPASVETGFDWDLGGGNALGFGVSRVMYSDVTPFTSTALPTSVLALLGDGTSPAFAWRDLTVYSAAWSWQASADNRIMLRYFTQQQPEPTSELLALAMSENFSDNNFAVSLDHRLSDESAVRLGAAYAPSQYYVGNADYSESNSSSDQIEVMAIWSVRF
jgi:hypothetical protein